MHIILRVLFVLNLRLWLFFSPMRNPDGRMETGGKIRRRALNFLARWHRERVLGRQIVFLFTTWNIRMRAGHTYTLPPVNNLI